MTTSRSWTASYYGRCGVCGDTIRPGESACYLDGETVHDSCVPDNDQQPDSGDPFAQPSAAPDIHIRGKRQPSVCPSCFLAHAGECF